MANCAVGKVARSRESFVAQQFPVISGYLLSKKNFFDFKSEMAKFQLIRN
jgi:hypothetical protein